MSHGGAETDVRALPGEFPVFPLTGALLLPGGQLPLNIFEPRYLAMINSALGAGRWLGMVQPRDTTDQTVADTHPLFETGCLGRITSFSETDDGRYLISLNGVCRYGIKAELKLTDGYRRVVPDYDDFAGDLVPTTLGSQGRDGLDEALKRYFHDCDIEADWEALEQTPDHVLVASMAMACPFSPAEKQALLEADGLQSRTQCLIAILDMAAHDGGHGRERPRH